MLSAMRKGSDNWFIKIFLGIVILGFIATGGLVSYSAIQSGANVATVGDASVSSESFFNAFNNEVNRANQGASQPLSPEFLSLIGQQVMNGAVNRATMENKAMVLNLAVDDNVAAQAIRQDPAFTGSDGNFNKAIFDDALRRNNLTEKSYVELIKTQEVISQLTDSLADVQTSPGIYVSIINEFNNQQRIAEYFHMKETAFKTPETPTDAALDAYYQNIINQFNAPEYRSVELLSLTPETLAKTIQVSDADAREIYENTKDIYSTNETREISQIIYNNAEEAQADYDKSLTGTTFAELLTAKGLSVNGAMFGTFEKDGLPLESMKNAVFALELNTVSKPVDLGISVVLLYVSNITPASSKSFEDVKADIVKAEQLRLAADKIYDMRNDVEDEIASGSSFEEVSKKLNIEFSAIPTLDTNSLDIDEKPVSLPQAIGLFQGIFASDVDLDNEPLDTLNGGLVWYKVNKIIDARNRDLSEVKDRVITLWKNTEVEKAMFDKADALVEKAGDIDELASGFSSVKISPALKRNDQSVQLPDNAIVALFAMKLDEYSYVASTIDDERAIIFMKLKEIIAPDTTDVDDNNNLIRQSIAPDIAATLLESYIENSKIIYGVTINQPLVDRIVGGHDPNDGGDHAGHNH